MDCIRTVINYIGNCCFSCQEDATSQGNVPNERTHLLQDPVSNSPAVRQTNHDNFIDEYPNSLPKKDEQTALNKIIQDTVANIIDVSAMDAHTLEPHEYNDRMRLYQHRLAQQWNKLPANGSAGELSTSTRRTNRKMIKNDKLFEGFILKDIPNPENVLSSTPIPADDINMMRNFVRNANTAMQEIKVKHVENLVVPFRIP